MAVVRAAQPWQVRLREMADRLLHLWVPQMDRTDRIQVYERLKTGSEWGFDFMMLTALSTSIAAFGLIQSSAAVVIGAMLVAPLMTPMLGAGLALLQGNRNLLLEALKSIALGFALALLIGCLVGLLSPVKVLTEEMQARGAPTLLDLSVALLAGFCRGLCLREAASIGSASRCGHRSSLGAAHRDDWGVFSLGGDRCSGRCCASVRDQCGVDYCGGYGLYCFGLRGRERTKGWENRAIQGLVVGVFLLAVPLSAFLWSVAQETPSGLSQTVRDVTADHDYRLIHLHRKDDVVEIKIQGPRQAPLKLQEILAETTRKQFGPEVRLRIITELAVEWNESH